MSDISMHSASETRKQQANVISTMTATSLWPCVNMCHARARMMVLMKVAEDFAGCRERQPKKQRLESPKLAPRRDGYMIRIMQRRLAISCVFPAEGFFV